MSDTLGSLVDKLAIVDLKLWHCQELLEGDAPATDDRGQLESKNTSLLGQRERLIQEIDAFFDAALQAKGPEGLLNPANKIYGRYRQGEE